MCARIFFLLAGALVLAVAEPAAAAPTFNITPLGFTDAEHTRSDGYRGTNVNNLNSAAQVAGYSQRYDGSTYMGVSAWLYDGTGIINIGLTGPEHTRNDGYRYSSPGNVNPAGVVAGISTRYNGGSANLGQTAWLYDGATTIVIGLTDSEHTRSDEYRFSSIVIDGNKQNYLNDRGQAAGASSRYDGGSTSLGQTAWLFDGATTIPIGFTDPEHTRNDGYRLSSPSLLNALGQVAGYATRFNGGSTDLGRSVWLYDGAATIPTGLTGPDYTRSDGYRYGWTIRLTDTGQVLGHANRYNGSTQSGQGAWFFDGENTVEIGFTGPEHTRSTGYKFTASSQMNQAGHVRGYSDRYNGGSTYLGRTAWIYNGTSTIEIGFTGTEHTRNDGYKFSATSDINQTGHVLGYSNRYDGGGIQLGQTAWLYDGTATIDIGLTGPEYTRADGHKFSSTLEMNQAGQVRGSSNRYDGGSTSLGATAWLYDGAATIEIGLYDAEHTRHDGFRSNTSVKLNEFGHVIGSTGRYNGGSTQRGQTAWLYNGATTIPIGLTGPEHTRDDGYKFSSVGKLNNAGQVAGYSQRYNGGSSYLGQDAWFYDPVLEQTFAFTLSTRSDGYASSRIDYLDDDGLVLGAYTLFDAAGNSLGDRGFYFTVADGLHDLGSLVEGGLAANGWEHLVGIGQLFGRRPTDAVAAAGRILGSGKLTSQPLGQFLYVLSPAIAGDFNGDGAVDAADYIFWRKSSDVPDDLDRWRAHFGSIRGSDGLALTNAAVPEPAAIALVALAMLSSPFRIRRRQ